MENYRSDIKKEKILKKIYFHDRSAGKSIFTKK